MKRVFFVSIMFMLVSVISYAATVRPKGSTRFQTLSAQKAPLPSLELDNELNNIVSAINSITVNSNASEWYDYGTGSFISSTSFSVTGDHTSEFIANRRTKFTLTGSTVYSSIVSCSYSSGSNATTVIIADAVLSNPVTRIYYSIVTPYALNGSVSPVMAGVYPTDASSNATPNTLVRRDSFGNFSTGRMYGNVTGSITNTIAASNTETPAYILYDNGDGIIKRKSYSSFTTLISGDITVITPGVTAPSEFTATDTSWTIPSYGMSITSVDIVGGGGGGNCGSGNGCAGSLGKGGGAAALTIGPSIDTLPGSKASITIGAGGTAGTSSGSPDFIWTAPGNGGATTIAIQQKLSGVPNSLMTSAAPLTARAVSISNRAITGLSGAVDGVTLVSGNRVLLVGQTDAKENGLWVASASAWSRASDLPAGTVLNTPKAFYVTEGTSYKYVAWWFTGSSISTVGTDSLVIEQASQTITRTATGGTGSASTTSTGVASPLSGTTYGKGGDAGGTSANGVAGNGGYVRINWL